MNQVIKKEEIGGLIVAKKKAILDIPEVQQGLTKGEFRLAKLSTSVPIMQIPDRDLRIKDGEEKDFGLVARVGILAKGIAKDFSIRNVDKTEAFRFLDVLKKYYSEMTLDEIRTAFELALVGELDAYLPKDRNGVPDKNHYQAFSLEFVTKILNAFKAYKGKVWKKVYMIEAKVEPEVTDEQKEQAKADFLAYVDELIKTYSNGEPVLILFPRTLKDHFVSIGVIEDRELSEADFGKAVAKLQTSDTINVWDKAGILEAYKSGDNSRLQSEAEHIKAEELVFLALSRLKVKGGVNEG